MKHLVNMNISESVAFDAIRALLRGVPSFQVKSVRYEDATLAQYKIDGLITFSHVGRDFSLAIHVKPNGAPRYVRAGVFQLESYIARSMGDRKGNPERRIIPMIVSQYLSPQSREICVDHGIAYLDLFGNTRLVFDAVFVERAVPDRPVTESRALRSLFSPKAAAILRVLLREPHRAWRVAELAREAHVSYGHVSNVRKALLEREWVEIGSDGVELKQPHALLQEWRDRYRRPVCESINGYTTFHGDQFTERLRGKLNPHPANPLAIYCLHSAAQLLGLNGRSTTHTFYVNKKGADLLYAALALTWNVEGPNVTLSVLKDESLFLDAVEPVPNVFCTSPIVTYLDLSTGDQRDREAATRLSQKSLPWLK